MTNLRRCAVALVGGLVLTVQASADTIYSLDLGNSPISGYAGPYGSVDVGLVDPTHATITFTANSVPGHDFLFGGQGSVALNVNGPFTVGSITGLGLPGFSPGPYSNGGVANEDGFGAFNLTIDSFDGYAHSATSITLGLTLTTGTWADSAHVLSANAGGYDVGAHVFVAAGSPANPDVSGLATGYAANGSDPLPPQSIPDGGTTALLLGAALSGLGLLRRKVS